MRRLGRRIALGGCGEGRHTIQAEGLADDVDIRGVIAFARPAAGDTLGFEPVAVADVVDRGPPDRKLGGDLGDSLQLVSGLHGDSLGVALVSTR